MRRAIAVTVASTAFLTLASCEGGDDSTRYESAAEMFDSLSTSFTECSVVEQADETPVSELSEGEVSRGWCGNREFPVLYRGAVSGGMSGEDMYQQERDESGWTPSGRGGAIIGENWIINCGEYADDGDIWPVTEESCQALAGQLGGKVEPYGE